MNHFGFLFAFALLVGIGFGVFAAGSTRDRILYGVRVFFQFVGISLVLAWIFYFIPW